MKTEYEFIRFMEKELPPGRKTKAWWCRDTRHKTDLGTIVWSGAWRQYVFAPAHYTEFSAGCLTDIQDFIGQAMRERKR